MFINGTVSVLFWVDDCIFHAKEANEIDVVFTSLKAEFLLECKDNVAGFL